MVSPGTLLDANYLDAREPAFLMSLGPDRGDRIGAALLDLTTGEFTVAEYAGPSRWQALDDELRVLRAAGAGRARGSRRSPRWRRKSRAAAFPSPRWTTGSSTPTRAPADACRAAAHAPASMASGLSATDRGDRRRRAALVAHLRDTQKADLAHVRTISLRQQADDLLIDPDHAQAPRGRRRHARAAAPGRCSTSSTRR